MNNKIIEHTNYTEIEIKNKDKVFYCKIDKEDIERIEKHSWSMSQGYAICTIKNKKVYMHRLLLTPPQNMQIDHINHDRLDNRRANLKICTQLENLKNRKFDYKKSIQIEKYESNKGTTWHLSILYDRRRHRIGKFKSYDEAFKAGTMCIQTMV